MLRTVCIAGLIIMVITSIALAYGQLWLRGVDNVKVGLVGDKLTGTTTDGTLATTKVAVGKSYTLMSQDESGPYAVGKVLVTKTKCRYFEGQLVGRS